MSSVETSSNLLFDAALDLALHQLALFAKSPSFLEKMAVAFGSSWSPVVAQNLVTELAHGKIPPIEVVADLGGAMGAYATDNNKIYLSQRFLLANQTNPQAIADVLLEEIGHSIDARLNTTDSAGDEGEIFAALVNNRQLGTAELAGLKSQNDHKTIVINGQSVAIEQATYGSINVDGNLADWTAAERIDVTKSMANMPPTIMCLALNRQWRSVLDRPFGLTLTKMRLRAIRFLVLPVVPNTTFKLVPMAKPIFILAAKVKP
jgi:hypothetical protein